MRFSTLILLAVLAGPLSAPALASPLSVTIEPAPGNPDTPKMGDHLSFRTVIRNDGTTPIDGLVGWISLVQTDPGKEQPVDLEDWSAHKAVTQSSLAPGEQITTDWPMRLIQAGTYRVAVSAASRTGEALTSSPLMGFTVRPKPVVESVRVLPVALGIPILLAAGMGWSRLRRSDRVGNGD